MEDSQRMKSARLALVICLVAILGTRTGTDAETPLKFSVLPHPEKSEKRYVANQTGELLTIYDKVARRTIWKLETGATNHVIVLQIGPGAHYAVVAHDYGTKGQSLYWLDLTHHSPGSGLEIDMLPLDRMAGITAGAPFERFSYLFYNPGRWLREDTLALVR